HPGQGVARGRARPAGRRAPDGAVAMTPTAGKMTVDIIQGLLLAFAAVVIVMPAYIRLLLHAGMGKQILEEGPESHQVKRGTPTMGGLLVIGVVLGLFFFLR